jgi:hypothetical protein
VCVCACVCMCVCVCNEAGRFFIVVVVQFVYIHVL